MTPEKKVQAAILGDLGCEPGLRLFRNNVGVAVFPGGERVAYGLAPGSSDLIGWRTIKVTPRMVGLEIAVFTAIEVKPDYGVASDKQDNFIARVREAGGIAGIARTANEARELVGLDNE